MEIFDTGIEGLKLLQPRIFLDERGAFFESHNDATLKILGVDATFVQDNESSSKIGVLRGLHFQQGEYAQAKLVRVVRGTVLDVAVDLRWHSPTFCKHFSVELSSDNKKQLFIPRGFAHGFITLEENTILQYKCDNYYHKESEDGIRFDDPTLAIDWHFTRDQISVNERDANFQSINEYISTCKA